MTQAKRRWGFRARLTALIAVVFVAGGAALLGVQYLLVQELFESAIGDVSGCTDGETVTVTAGERQHGDSPCEGVVQAGASSGGDGYAVFVRQSSMLSQEVLSGLLLWSIVTLLAFAVVAILAASWLAHRSFARIGRITGATRRITRDDLHQRLQLSGPADEIKELGDTIDTMLDRLDASFAQQERFITNASHELRTPLTTTRTALEIPLQQGAVPEHLQPAIRRALHANRRSERLIAALLELARATAGVRDAERPGDPIDLASLVGAAVARRRKEIDERHLAVSLVLIEACVRGVDETLLVLAIDNLLDNAVRHNIDHGTLDVSVGGTAGGAWVEVANSGAPFTLAEAERLIEPFNRGPRTRTVAGGLGLGLSLVQNVAASVGAEFTLTPVPSGGLVARLGFPPPPRR
jgi:signal transduction histidine kinase